MNNNWRRRNSRNIAFFKYGHTPANRKWLIATLVSAGIMLFLLLWMLFGPGNMSLRTVLWLRGFTGVFALISIICAVVYYYRIYSDYWNNPNNNKG